MEQDRTRCRAHAGALLGRVHETQAMPTTTEPHAAAGDLPFVDEHAIVIDRPLADVWRALLAVLDGSFSGGRTARVAGILGCAQTAVGGPRPLAVGSTFPGFEVVGVEPERMLTLAGRHRFSRYALVFEIDALGPSQQRVRAVTRAVFPGLHGAVYRALVIGTRGHVVAVKRMLSAVQRRAQRPARQPPR
jgi:hypothetical protein